MTNSLDAHAILKQDIFIITNKHFRALQGKQITFLKTQSSNTVLIDTIHTMYIQYTSQLV